MTNGVTPTDVDMMHGMFSIYRSNDEFISKDFPVQSFVLQYQGKRLSMIVLLPAPEVNLDDIILKVILKVFLKTIYWSFKGYLKVMLIFFRRLFLGIGLGAKFDLSTFEKTNKIQIIILG